MSLSNILYVHTWEFLLLSPIPQYSFLSSRSCFGLAACTIQEGSCSVPGHEVLLKMVWWGQG